MPAQYDVVVLGAGPAGEGAAMRAAKLGKNVAVVDDKRAVGGNCAHLGTIPSKALRQNVRQIMKFNTNPMFRVIGEPKFVSFAEIMQNAKDVIQQQVALRSSFYSRNRVAMFHGSAQFLDSHTVEVHTGDGVSETLIGNEIVIATFSNHGWES